MPNRNTELVHQGDNKPIRGLHLPTHPALPDRTIYRPARKLSRVESIQLLIQAASPSER